jgi:putative DNA methylase
MSYKKKLIEVALPLEAINEASVREKSIRHGHPSTLHLWWARRPLAAARAVIFAQMVDDPSSRPELFPTEEAQEKERQRLFRIIEDLVKWENTTNETVLQRARDEIRASWRRTCAENADHPRAKELFDPNKLPAFHDPFAGGGSLPLEAQRLGLEAYASDLNPVAVLICKAMIEIPPKFAGRPPVNPEARKELRVERKEYALSRSGSLAERDGGGARAVSACAADSQGRDVRDAVSDNKGDRIDSSEYSRGMGQGIGTGEGSVPGGGARISGGSGNAHYAVREPGLVSGNEDADSSGVAGRGQPHAHNAPPEVSKPLTLSPLSSSLFPRPWKGAQGLAEDVRYYGKWMRDEAEKRIGHLYPKIEITAEMARERPDLKPLVGNKLTVIAWLWARTVKSPNPAFAHVDVPLVSTFMLSTKPGKEAYVEVVRTQDLGLSGYRFTVKVGKPKNPEAVKNGTKLSRGANFRCVMSDIPIPGDYIKAEGRAGRMGARLMAIVAEGERGRLYISPTPDHEAIARRAKPAWRPETPIPPDPRALWTPPYGLTTFGDLFTPRQLVALTTFSDLVGEAMELIRRDAVAAGLPDDGIPLREGGTGAQAYAEAIATYLGLGLGRSANYWSSLTPWGGDFLVQTFGRQAIPMVWDYAEGNPLSHSTGNWSGALQWIEKVIVNALPALHKGNAFEADAQRQTMSNDKLISTDPPYYDNVGYADLSDYFYVWLRRSLKPVFPDLLATLATPKAEELVATPYRHGSKDNAETFFLEGMRKAMHRLAEESHPAFPVTIYYAFKQSEIETDGGTARTGWETFLEAVIRAGFALSGTWPMRTERDQGLKTGLNVLASSIILVCRPREAGAPTATRREFLSALKAELPAALANLQRGNIAPVDLAQAAIGPGMAVYTRYSKVIDAAGRPLSVRDALALINQVLDEVLAEQEGDFDADTRFAIAWFEQQGFSEGEFGVADVLARAKNTSVAGMVEAGILASKRGKVRLLKPEELPEDWDPATDSRLTAWEIVHHMIRKLESGGETAAAELAVRLGSSADVARELAYRLYAVCERRKRAQEAIAYNSLVIAWPEIIKLASAGRRPAEQRLFE